MINPRSILVRRTRFLAGAAALIFLAWGLALRAAEKPNIVFILADDLGYGDVGAFGQKKIRTPNLDRLAAEGMRLTQHYSGNAVCAPSRCVLMTGKHPGHAYIRNNRELRPEGQEPLPAETMTLAKRLREAGYTTGAFGKWGLGGPGSSGDPLNQGFDRFYGYNCQRVAHNYYPTYLWDNDRRVELDNPDFAAHQKLPEGADPSDPASYQPYAGREYAPDLIMAQAREFVKANREKPFFLYVPTTVPHLALQVPEDSLAEYKDQFADEPYPGGRSYLPHPFPRAAYAAMVTRLDAEIGRIVELVQELGLEQKTLFVFSSDNGPLFNRLGGTDSDYFDSAAGLRGRKGSLYEGGVRVPTIVRWKGRIQPGTASARVTGFEDWLPTLLELAGTKSPGGIDGINFAPVLFGEKLPEREFLYREFPAYGGQQSLRMGDWKAIRVNLMGNRQNHPGAGKLELYDLKNDPGESRDAAADNPEIVDRMERVMRREHVPSPVFAFPALDADAN